MLDGQSLQEYVQRVVEEGRRREFEEEDFGKNGRREREILPTAPAGSGSEDEASSMALAWLWRRRLDARDAYTLSDNTQWLRSRCQRSIKQSEGGKENRERESRWLRKNGAAPSKDSLSFVVVVDRCRISASGMRSSLSLSLYVAMPVAMGLGMIERPC